jgi:cyanophycinase
MDERLLALLPTAARVVIIPTAAVRGSPHMTADNGVRHFAALGAMTTAAMVITPADADDAVLVAPLAVADMVYLAGGDPGYLLDVLRGRDGQGSLLWREMLAVYTRGGMLAGSSAGAMVLSAKMRTWNVGEWTAGQSLAPFAVLVHHNGPDDTGAETLHAALTPPMPIVGIAEATACISVDARHQAWEVAGVWRVTIYPPALTPPQRYDHGSTFSL